MAQARARGRRSQRFMEARLDAAVPSLRLRFADIGEFAECYAGALLQGVLFVPCEKLTEVEPGAHWLLEFTLPGRTREVPEGSDGKDFAIRAELRSLQERAPIGGHFDVGPLSEALRVAIESYLTQVLRGEEPAGTFPTCESLRAAESLAGDAATCAGDRALAFQEEATGRALDGRSIQTQLREMTHAERIRLALSGGKAARAALIRNPQPVYHPYVVQNPRITRSELAAIAKNPNVAPEALRMIAGNAQHMSDPAIRLNIVKNPKTDGQVAQKFLPRLSQSQLRQLARSDEVRPNLKSAAVRLLNRSQH